MKHIGLDVGYRGTKALDSDGNKFHQPSVVGVQTEARFSLRGETAFSISLDGTDRGWYVGETALRQSEYDAARRDPEWVFSEHYKVLFYAALSELCKGSSHTHVKLVTGLPLQDYDALAVRAQEVFVGEHTFRRNSGAVQTVIVEDCYCVTQPFGSLADMAMTERGEFLDNPFAYGTVGIGDIGGNTFNILTATEMEEIGKWTEGDGLGLLNAMNSIAKAIRKDHPGFNPKAHEVAEWVAQGWFPYGDEKVNISEYAIPHLRPLAQLVVNRMSEVWREPGRLQAVLLTGGGSLILGQVLRQMMAKTYANVTIAQDAIFANARGYLKLSYYFWAEVLDEIQRLHPR